MKRSFLLAVGFLLTLLLVFACVQLVVLQNKNNQFRQFRFETNCILIYTEDDDFTTPLEIRDSHSIDKLIASIDTAQWKSVPLEQEIAAAPYYCVDFQNGTVITLLSDTAYGFIGSGLTIQWNGTGQIVSLGLDSPSYGPFFLNEALFLIIKELTNPNA